MIFCSTHRLASGSVVIRGFIHKLMETDTENPCQKGRAWGILQKMGRNGCRSQRGQERHKKTKRINQPRLIGAHRNGTYNQELTQALCIQVTVVQLSLLMCLSTIGVKAVSYLPFSWDPFLLQGCLFQPYYKGRCLVLLQFDMPRMTSMGLLSFSEEKWKGSKWRELGGEERGKTEVRI